MEKQIIFTLSREQYRMRWHTKSVLADKSDRCKYTVACAVASDMMALTTKYNDRNIAVLFDVE